MELLQDSDINKSASRNSSGSNKELTCPICLHVWNDPTVLDICSHVFCFECIIEWTRLKPECPLCKRGLKLLKHQLSIDNQEIPPTWASEGKEENIVELRSEYELEQINARTSYPADVEWHQVNQVVQHIKAEIRLWRAHAVTTMANPSIYRNALNELEEELSEYQHLLGLFNSNAKRSKLFSQPAFRRVIYLKNLSPRSINPPMFNVVVNAEYINGNREIVRDQLEPFVIREVKALTREDYRNIEALMNMLLDYMGAKINRTEIVIFLKKQGIMNPHHFLNNLSHFASSGQTLKVYDQNSEYNARNTPYTGALFPDDDDVLVLHNGAADVEVVGERRMDRAASERPSNNQSNIPLRPNFSRGPRTPPHMTLLDHPMQNDVDQQQHQSSSSAWPSGPLDNLRRHVFGFMDLSRNYLYQSSFPSAWRREHQMQQPPSQMDSVTNNNSNGGGHTPNSDVGELGEQRLQQRPTTSGSFADVLLRDFSPRRVRRRNHSPPRPPLPPRASSPPSSRDNDTTVTLDDDESNAEDDDAVEFVQEVKRRRKQYLEEEEEEEEGENDDGAGENHQK